MLPEVLGLASGVCLALGPEYPEVAHGAQSETEWGSYLGTSLHLSICMTRKHTLVGCSLSLDWSVNIAAQQAACLAKRHLWLDPEEACVPYECRSVLHNSDVTNIPIMALQLYTMCLHAVAIPRSTTALFNPIATP